MSDEPEETTKDVLVSLCENTSEMNGELWRIAEALESLVELFKEASFTYGHGSPVVNRAIRTSSVD